VPPLTKHRRLRALSWFFAGWGAVTLGVQGALAAAGAQIRRFGVDPREPVGTETGIRNLRAVGADLLVGAQPRRDAYTTLAALGVDVVVDLRTGVIGDPHLDDGAHLRALGMRLARVPVPDGDVPASAARARIAEVIEGSNRAFVHCGAGVGRSSVVAALHERTRGIRPRVADQLAVGPPSIAQLVFVARLRPDRRVGDPARWIVIVSRVIDLPRRALSVARGLMATDRGSCRYRSRAASRLPAR
jgi:hypothetical protein